MTSLRSASVVALDLNCHPSQLRLALEFCKKFVEDALLFLPRDEIALVFAGTSGTHDPANISDHSGDRGQPFAHISVPYPLAAPTVDILEFLKCTARLLVGKYHEVDFLETLFVCGHVLCGKGANRRYSKRVIYLLTDARVDVVRKGEVRKLLEFFWQHNISLVVIAIDFTDAEELEEFVDKKASVVDNDHHGSDTKLDAIPVKTQNERVLRIMCSSLGGYSTLLSLEEALGCVGGLQRRTILQRPLLKVILTIGDVRLATQMFTKTHEEHLPTLKKMTAAGEEVNVRPVYMGLADCAAELQQEYFVMGYNYGSAFIPSAEPIIESVKIKGVRALDAVGFVPTEQVPVHVLLGGVKVITPISDDMIGAKAFRSIVRAMVAAKQAMIARFVRTNDADPILGICVPSVSERRDVLFFSPIPFAEDVRFFEFLDDARMMRCGCDDSKTGRSDEEEKLLESIVEEMTVGKNVLRPRDTFNPATQQFYATLREKLGRCCDGETEGDVGDREVGANASVRGAATTSRTHNEVLLPLLADLQATSTAFGLPGNQLEPMMSGVCAKLEACAHAFA